MYTVLFPSGNTLVFSVKALAETYVMAYRGVLIGSPENNPTETMVIPESACL
jgi:hypothetical protein